MKELDLNQMEKNEGGISCYDVESVITWLKQNNYAQYAALQGSWVQCMAGTIRGEVLIN